MRLPELRLAISGAGAGGSVAVASNEGVATEEPQEEGEPRQDGSAPVDVPQQVNRQEAVREEQSARLLHLLTHLLVLPELVEWVEEGERLQDDDLLYGGHGAEDWRRGLEDARFRTLQENSGQA